MIYSENIKTRLVLFLFTEEKNCFSNKVSFLYDVINDPQQDVVERQRDHLTVTPSQLYVNNWKIDRGSSNYGSSLLNCHPTFGNQMTIHLEEGRRQSHCKLSVHT